MHVIKLPSRCDRASIVALLPEFVAVQAEPRVIIDATEVEQVGQAALQLLVSARRSMDCAAITPSAALFDAAQLAGLSEILFDGEA
ncbi:MAG: STAS domain-containing protein [Novosphingobium sp.]